MLNEHHPEPSLWSIGRLAERLQATPREIIRAAERINTRPMLWLDGVPYYAEEVEPQLREALNV